jgi:hypothetical protein
VIAGLFGMHVTLGVDTRRDTGPSRYAP